MVPLYFAIVVFAIVLNSLAETSYVSSVRDRSKALSNNIKFHGRRQVPVSYRFVPPATGGTESDDNDDHQLLDIVLVASVDGKFHALDRASGHRLWSMSSSAVSSAPSGVEPLVRTTHIESDPDLTDDDSLHQELYVIEPQTGEIYVMSSPTSPLQRLPFSMSQLVDMSPYMFEGDEDRRVFVGKKETSLLLVELETGKIKATINSECPWNPFDDLTEKIPTELDLDDLEGDSPPISRPTEVFIGRTDYHIAIHTRPTNPSSPIPPVQNLSFSTYGPNNQDSALQSVYRRTADDAYIHSLPNGEIISFKARGVDSEIPVSHDSQLLWYHTFTEPIVAVFDVLKTSGRQDPFVLLQPRARLQDVMPDIDLPAAAKLDRFPNLESAYVGLVKDSGSLFAMTPDRFPLVIFGDANFDRSGRRLIDPPADAVFDSDLPPDVDAVTKARKSKQMCRNGSGDRRCLTGVRRLEESGRSRLLDGAASVALPLNTNSNSQVVEQGDAYSEDTYQTSNSWSNGSIVPPWVWGANGRVSTDGTRLLGLEVPVDALSALASLIITAVLSLVWVAAKVQGKKNVVAHPRVINRVTMDQGETPPLLEQQGDTLLLDHTRQDNVYISDPPESPVTLKLDLRHAKSTDAVEEAVDGEESDRDADIAAIPGKRKGPRRRRGKKKKGNAIAGAAEEGEDEEKPLNGGDGYLPELPKESVDSPPATALIVPSTPEPTAPSSLVVSDTILGFGSHGTVVFRGSFQGRSVAVKRLLQDFVTLASREVDVLQESDHHPNVIRYFYQEAHANFLYIALELCPASLADVVETPDQFRDICISFEPKRALQQITSGLRHLHALKIIHRDIKPQNILISNAKQGSGKHAGHRMLISDFGLCKKLDVDQTSFLPTANGAMAAGTVGWRAPEILRGEVKLDDSLGDDHSQSSRGSVGSSTGSMGRLTRLTKSVDIFALGCLFYYTLTNGSHPFGDRFEREVNILKNAKCLDGLERFGEEGSEAVDLIGAMLNPAASGRPDAMTCLLHPFFWDPGRRLTFLQDASDRFEVMCREPRDPNLNTLEINAFAIVGNDWHSRLDKVFIENLGKFRKYDGKSVQDLLRALRNKKNHYQDLPDHVKRHLGPMPEGFLSYFTRRFPDLFLHVHSVIAGTSLRSESMFRSYFELID